MELKDWLTTIPAWIGMISGSISFGFLARREWRERQSREPRIELTYQPYIVATAWFVQIEVEPRDDTLVIIDGVEILRPANWKLGHDTGVGIELENLARFAPKLKIETQRARRDAPARWIGFAIAADQQSPVAPPVDIELVVSARLIGRRERHRRFRIRRRLSP